MPLPPPPRPIGNGKVHAIGMSHNPPGMIGSWPLGSMYFRGLFAECRAYNRRSCGTPQGRAGCHVGRVSATLAVSSEQERRRALACGPAVYSYETLTVVTSSSV